MAEVGEEPEKMLGILSLDDQEDTSCMTFVLQGEDHTLGNALRYIIMKNPEVTFCGYSVPHPSESKIHLRVQTSGAPATEALRKGLEDLHELCSHVLATFEDSVEQFKSQQDGQEIPMSS